MGKKGELYDTDSDWTLKEAFGESSEAEVVFTTIKELDGKDILYDNIGEVDVKGRGFYGIRRKRPRVKSQSVDCHCRLTGVDIKGNESGCPWVPQEDSLAREAEIHGLEDRLAAVQERLARFQDL